MSIADYMRPPTQESEINYPLVHDGGSRIQVVYSETVYGMLIQNPNAPYWCGYTLLSQKQAEEIDSWRPILGASYLGPANTPITWYAPDKFGVLNGPSSLLIHKGGDFWIGFHAPNESPIDRISALAKLGRFVHDVHRVLHRNANTPV